MATPRKPPPAKAQKPRPAPPQQKRAPAKRPTKSREEPRPPHSGKVALIGRPNVGKSTLLNAALEQPLAIVSPTPQTTRDAILGVVHHHGAEIALLDTPGIHRPRTELGRIMNATARDAARNADVVVFVTDVPLVRTKKPMPGKPEQVERPLTPHPGDLTLLADIGADKPTLLVVNKVDRVKDKSRLLPLLEALSKVRQFAAIVPISALREDGLARVLDEIAELCPPGPFRYGPDEMTDRPTRFFAAEYVREQILRATQAEVPHAVAVIIDRFVEPPTPRSAIHIDATIWVEKTGQKRILIGKAGEMLKRIGTQARLRIEELTGHKVNLKLWVRITPDWRRSRAQLEELGYTKPGETGPGTLILFEPEDHDSLGLAEEGEDEEDELEEGGET